MVAHDQRKRARLSEVALAQTKAPNFTNGRDIQAFFRSSSTSGAVDALKALRNKITLRAGESSVSAQDARLFLVKEWLEASPGAQDVFGVLERGPQPAAAAVCVSILSCLLTLTSLHFVYQPLGQPIVKRLLTNQWLRKFDSYLSGAHSDLCLAALKLLNAIANFAGGKEQKGLLEAFSWDVKVFHKLLYMRRKGKDSEHDILVRPDIRTLCLQFILSFVSSSSNLKVMFLEQHRDVFLSIFKGLNQDPHPVVRYVLEILWTNLWQDQKIKRTLKVGLFGETTVQHLLKLYERSAQEGPDPEHVSADVVHHFLLAICTHRGVGICFADNGWYPQRDSNVEAMQKVGRIHNKILANVLKMLKVNDDARQQELALKVLRACPELVAGYIQSAGLTLEPRLSSKWLANIAFLGAVVSLPVPVDSFYLPAGMAGSSSAPAQYTYQPVPPPLATVLENSFPSANLKTHLSKALQSPSALVQHAAGLTLAQCLQKCEAVRDAFRVVERALEEDECEGQWAKRRMEVEREVRRRVPEFQVIIAFSNTHRAAGGADNGPISIKTALLSELAQRLLWLYHLCVPSLVAEARYDVGKSLQTFLDLDSLGADVSTQIEGLNCLQQLHVLRMLKESDQFAWFAKAAPSAPSNILILLKLFKTNHEDIRDALTSLLMQALKDSLLFQHDPEELQLWLDALPLSVRSPDVEAPDSAPLTDEYKAIVAFLDECMQRCVKTPHRYLEELDALVGSSMSSDETVPDMSRSSSISPMMMTALEQLGAKMRNALLSPSDGLALTTYIRKVIVSLLGKQSDLVLCRAVATTFATIVVGEGVFAAYPVIAAALRKEIEILDASIGRCSSESRAVDDRMEGSPSEVVLNFVAQLKRLCVAEGDLAVIQAYELVDWLRLIDQPLNTETVDRLVVVIKRLHPAALSSLFLYLSPESSLLWSLKSEDIVQWASIEWLLLHASSEHLGTSRCISILDKALMSSRRSLYSYKRIGGILIHRFGGHKRTAEAGYVLDTLSSLITYAKKDLPARAFSSFKSFVLVERQNIRLLSCANDLPASVTTALSRLLDIMLDRSVNADRLLVSSICKHWVAYINTGMIKSPAQNFSGGLAWIKFMAFDDLINLAEKVLRTLQSRLDGDTAMMNDGPLTLIEELLSSLVRYEGKLVSGWLNEHLPTLLLLRKLLPTVKMLEGVIARSIGASVPLGCDGFPVLTGENTLTAVVDAAYMHWASRLSHLPQNASINDLLGQTLWSQDISSAIASFMYRSSAARNVFWMWLASGGLSGKPALDRLVPAVHAFFDSGYGEELDIATDDGFMQTLFSAIAKHFFNSTGEGRDSHVFSVCLLKMIERCPAQRKDFMKVLLKRASGLSVDSLHRESLRMAVELNHAGAEDIGPFTEAIINHALQWAVRYLSDNINSSDMDEYSFDDLVALLRRGKGIVPHFAEPVIIAAIRHHLHHSMVISLAEVLFSNTSLKPVNVNRHIQNVLQHVQFSRLAVTDVSSKEREAVVKLLFTMFHVYPTNTCKPSHVQPLIQLYSGSLSSPDRQLFAIFHLFEVQRKTSIASIFAQWSQAGLSIPQTSLDAISNLDANRVLRTCLTFPDRRTTAVNSGHEVKSSRTEDGLVYDPIFILLLFSQALVESPPQSTLAWVSLYRTNVVSLVIRCISSADSAVRRLALLQLGVLWKLMQAADMQEKGHVIHLLDLLRDQLPETTEPTESPIRLASYTTLLLAHALRGIFYPSNFIYPITARFLLQRPELDLHDVPMLYGMLYSSSDDWKKERGWMIRFLADGMLSSEDWRLLKRRHTWDLLASLFQGSYNDRPLRHGILEVLANLTSHSQATTSLVLKSSLIQWMEMQLLTMKSDENIAWTKIVENILVVVDPEKLEQATKGEWQAGLLRCLTSLMHDADITLLRLIARSMARLTSKRLQFSLNVDRAVELAFLRLIAYEKSSALPFSEHRCHGSAASEVLPPHRSYELHQLPFEDSLETWGSVVENLWSVSMNHSVKGAIWDQFSSRLLLWRSVCGVVESSVGEWARKQTVALLKAEGTR